MQTIFYIHNILFHYHRGRIKQRLGLYHGVMPIYMQFSNDAEETFARALKLLLVSDMSIYWTQLPILWTFF
jgi:hypothetical protein